MSICWLLCTSMSTLECNSSSSSSNMSWDPLYLIQWCLRAPYVAVLSAAAAGCQERQASSASTQSTSAQKQMQPWLTQQQPATLLLLLLLGLQG
jgi:predicted phosphoadenosine phosphosulfate sulfurtransferase